MQRDGKLLRYTYQDYWNTCVQFAKAMHVVGAQERKAVNVMGHNSPEWVISFQAAIMYNAVSTGVYITNLEDACLYQAEHSEAEVIVVDSIANLKKYTAYLPKY